MLQSEMSIQKAVKASASFGSTDGSHQLHLCFDNIRPTEYDPDVVFDKNSIFSAFCSKCCFLMKPTYIQVLIKNKLLNLKENFFQ